VPLPRCFGNIARGLNFEATGGFKGGRTLRGSRRPRSVALTRSVSQAQAIQEASMLTIPGIGERGASALVFALMLEVFNQLRELVVLGIEIGDRQLEDLGDALQCLQVGLVYPCLVTIDARTRYKLVDSSLDSQGLLRDPAGFPRLAEAAAVGGKGLFIDHGCMYFGLPCRKLPYAIAVAILR